MLRKDYDLKFEPQKWVQMKHIGYPKRNIDQIPSIGFLHGSLLVHQTAIPCEIDVGDPEGPRQVASLSVVSCHVG